MTETLLDFSSEISDYEYITQNKIVKLVDSLKVHHIFIKEMNNNFLQDFIVLFPKKLFFFTVTLYGGGSSGFKESYTSNKATGGYSSGCIVRFPIEIKNDAGNYFAKVRIGKGGNGFDISERIIGNNGEFSNFDLVTSNETTINPYKTAKGRTNVTIHEGFSSYGSGKLLDGTIIETTSTNTYFSFNGSNRENTSVKNTNSRMDHRNFYAPYTNEYNGYNSFIGIGGDYLGDINGEENTGAGGAGVYNYTNGPILKKVGKGGNGGCIIEYEGNDKLDIYADGYLYIPNGNNKLVFIVYDDDSGSRKIEIVFDFGIYSIAFIIEYIKQVLNQSVPANVLENESKLVVKMIYSWSIDINTSSGDLLIDLGIMNSDLYKDKKLQRAKLIDGVYQLPFSGQIASICNLNLFNSNKIFA
jgi:hypothetical protein